MLLPMLMTVAAIAPASPAKAVASAGVSHACDAYGHCVTGSAFSSNSAVNVSVVDTGVGAAVAGCKGTANGSTLIVVTCSIGTRSQTMSFPGTAGVVAAATDTSTLGRVPVCWRVVAYFPNLSGMPYEVPVDGCALVAL
ncbi:MAG TPA: hypothetical protein VEU29_07940 [Actinomycetota bacterium]|nr:hypothetical protein [Actinomycetota bacterium]